jgi:hypothetical protein
MLKELVGKLLQIDLLSGTGNHKSSFMEGVAQNVGHNISWN